MLLGDLPARLAEEFSYPVDIDTVVEQLGAVRVDRGNGSEPETVASILGHLGLERFDSSTMLFEAIYGNVSDDHVGRKYYDDRGGNVTGIDEGPRDDVNVSF